MHCHLSLILTAGCREDSLVIGVGDGGHVPAQIPEKYFSGNIYVKFGHFLGKNHVKFGNFVNFLGKYKNLRVLIIFRARIK